MPDFGAFLSSLPQAPNRPRQDAVEETQEFRRIRDAERRVWQDAPELPQLIARLTQHLKTPKGQQVLRPAQAAVLRDLHDRRGTFALMRTDAGKTHTSLLAAEVVDAKRPLLLVPAALDRRGTSKTRREAREIAEHWKVRPIRICSYEKLSRVGYATALARWAPDLIIADECDKLKNTRSACTRRVGRYVKKAGPYLLLMTGSPTSRSGLDYWHLLRWALREGAPVPADPFERQAWCWALDEKVSELVRIEPGALLDLSPPLPDDGEGIQAARKRFSRRLLSTPGIIGTGSDVPNVPLTCQIVRQQASPAVLAAAASLENWETPGGEQFETALDKWRHERELACGLYYRFKVPPPKPWLNARREWGSYFREALSRSRTLDTPHAVALAIQAGLRQDNGVLAAWREIEPTHIPETEPVWICDRTLEFAAKWLAEEGGLCWVLHIAFGERLSAETGVPYFREGGCDARGRSIDRHTGPAVASISSCIRGFNLQDLQHKNLVITCPTKHGPLEQLISRTHRDRQKKPVLVQFLQTLPGDVKALEQARADAVHVQDTLSMPPRVSVAKWLDAVDV